MATNIIKNGTFASDISFWSATTGTIAHDTDRLQNNGESDNVAVGELSSVVTTGNTIKIEFELDATSADNVELSFYASGVQGDILYINVEAGANTISEYIEVGIDADSVGIAMSTSDNVSYIDNVEVYDDGVFAGYVSLIPDKSTVGIIKKVNISIDCGVPLRHVSRYYYYLTSGWSLKDSTGTDIEDTTPEYAETTYATEDEVQIHSLGLKYKYAGVDPLNTTGNYHLYHPSAIDVNGQRVNGDIWVVSGTINEYSMIDETHSTKFEAPNFGTVSVRSGGGDSVDEDYALGFFLDGIGGESIYSSITFNFYKNGTTDDKVHPSFQVDLGLKDRVYIKVPTWSPGGGLNLYSSVEAIISSNRLVTHPEGSGSAKARIGMAALVWGKEIGCALEGHIKNRTAEFKTVISDNAEKTVISKSYDTFSGTVLVESVDLPDAEVILSRATSGDYVFHTGTGMELLDQRVYACKLKYSIPAPNTPQYDVQISGQSHSYNVDNYMIQPDSTDGFPI